jgi:hypothetical protein
MTERVEIVGTALAPGALWTPVIGEEANRLLSAANLDPQSRMRVEDQSVGILASCSPPGSVGGRAGLVVGYVQSGKTLSFTVVTALARDNGFPLVILLAGTKKNLHQQTSKRLRSDLQVEREGGISPWSLVDNPRIDGPEGESVRNAVLTFSNTAIPLAFRPTSVITVMKNPTRLDSVTELVRGLRNDGALTDSTPVLVVDDEADQAGLNAGDADDPSATYAAIMRLRGTIPSHTYLMYTATPQAPLLLNLADTLSPEFVRVLDAGPAYTGGEYFFVQHRSDFVETIPDSESQAAVDPETQEPPETLLAALATFLVGVVSQAGQKQLSMLVHPSHTRDLHTRYKQWLVGATKAWAQTLAEPGIDRSELIAEYLKPAWRQLKERGAPVTPLDQFVDMLTWYLPKVQVRVVNSTADDGEIPWNSAPAWILVGGNKLDRGFTVEGLSVTYMPRGTGVNNADTIQQRARFFGYKRSYAEFCRAWLAPTTGTAFERYVEHEQHLRRELVELEKQGRGLRDWKRKMLLDPALKPCRRSVIGLPHLHSRVPANRWIRFERLAALGGADLDRNQRLVSKLEAGLQWTADPRDARPVDRNLIASTALGSLVDVFLEPWAAHPLDRATLNQLLLVLGAGLDLNPDEPVDVMMMRGGLPRSRKLVSPGEGTVLNLQEGQRTAKDGYPGDAAFRTEDRITLQVFVVDATESTDGPVAAGDLRGLAVWVPAHLAGGALVQVAE